jgi:hypothetical protein
VLNCLAEYIIGFVQHLKQREAKTNFYSQHGQIFFLQIDQYGFKKKTLKYYDDFKNVNSSNCEKINSQIFVTAV